MASKKNESNVVPVINRTEAIYDLAYYNDATSVGAAGEAAVIEKKTASILALLPGLNYVDGELLQRAGVGREGLDPFEHTRGRVSIKGPDSVDEWAAVELAKSTTSADALARWLAAEQRPNVRVEVEKRLEHRRGKLQAA